MPSGRSCSLWSMRQRFAGRSMACNMQRWQPSSGSGPSLPAKWLHVSWPGVTAARCTAMAATTDSATTGRVEFSLPKTIRVRTFRGRRTLLTCRHFAPSAASRMARPTCSTWSRISINIRFSCRSARRCESAAAQDGDDGRVVVVADMTVAYKVFRETFASRVTLDRPDLKIVVEYLDGPFSHLENRWTFRDDGKGGCVVEFYIDYAFRSRTLGFLMGAMFDAAFRRFSAAFEARADRSLWQAGSDPGGRVRRARHARRRAAAASPAPGDRALANLLAPHRPELPLDVKAARPPGQRDEMDKADRLGLGRTAGAGYSCDRDGELRARMTQRTFGHGEATGSLTAPHCSRSSCDTPSMSILASFE